MTYELPESDVLTYLKYAKQTLPRHTSYPATPYWQEDFPLHTVQEALADLQKHKQDLSLYFHIPYCRQLCFYCACTKEIYPEERQKKHDPRESLLTGLLQEMDAYAKRLQGNTVHQIHLGGGTPTFLSPQQLQRLFEAIRSRFSIAESAEIAVEIDPRVTSFEHLQILREAGCNRVSLGVQDFSETVQKAVQRIQSYEMVERTVQQARDLGFSSINFDLIYGLPFQTLDSIKHTLEQTLKLSPDRIAFYRLSLIPELFKWQKSFRREHLPSERENIAIFLCALNMLTEGPYEFIGLDHFAKKEESLSASLQDGTLRRNFQGMTTGKSLAIIGMGPSAVSQIPGKFFWQNKKTSEAWHAALASESFVFEKGIKLSEDDRIRQELIHELYCYGYLDGSALHERTGVDMKSYFESEIQSLSSLEQDGILSVSKEGITLSPVLGRLLVRLVASYFDRYLQEERTVTQSTRFSQLG
jgi:oxygen-independent coproporphyrinogen-3 oxidase